MMDFLSFLKKQGYLTDEQYSQVESLVAEGQNLETAVERSGLSDAQLLIAKGEYYHVPVRNIDPADINDKTMSLIPGRSIEHYEIIPIGLFDGELLIGFVDPSNPSAREAADFIASSHNATVKPFVITRFNYERLQGNFETLTSEVGDALTDLEAELTLSTEEEEDINASDVEDAPVTKIVATILRHATEGNASDIHIEPFGDTIVRLRVDGAMKEALKLPQSVHNAVVARVKILCNMKLDEKRKPQDGRFSAHIKGRKIDYRVSTFPTYHGEKVVMRILDPERNLVRVSDLGLSERNHGLIMDVLNEPFGLILVSGPTGSGKSTTLYSMLKEVDRINKNVLSLEDPVEYQMDRVSQSSVHPEIGYTFATGLRTTLRQDPDVIMVGEIRDAETAQLAIQAALTGHLVLSTIHTNDATGVIPRLIDMGVDPYLIAPTLKLAIAQRLVKKLCPGAGKEIPVEDSIKRIIDEELSDLPPSLRDPIKIPSHVIQAAPSAGCPEGTRGRTAVFEVMRMNKQLEKALLEGKTESDIYNIAREDGMLTMREDAILKSFERVIPFEEVNRLGTGVFN